MIIKPRVRGFICINAHPDGCRARLEEQIAYTESLGRLAGPKKVLIIGCSMGYGLASRISAAFGCGADTVGVSYEREPAPDRTASSGWYNTLAFDAAARRKGLESRSINADAFSDATKNQVATLIKESLGTVDLLIYSLASPVRMHPKTGTVHRSAILPIGKPHRSKTITLDFRRRGATLSDIEIEPASDEEIASTVAVMGGEDWQMWIHTLEEEGLLSENFKTVAFTYLGNELTYPIYRGGTLGRAKADLDRVCGELNLRFEGRRASAHIAVLKAIVSQASTAIPVVPLYFSILFHVMKAAGNHEGPIEHINRLFREQLYSGALMRTDEEDRIRMDNFEELPEIQREVVRRWNAVSQDNINDLADVEGFMSEFMNLFGFEVPGVPYDREVDPMGSQLHF